jgi:hypothetical protein
MRFPAIGLAVVLASVVGAVAGRAFSVPQPPDVPKEIRAERFVLVGTKGEELASLERLPDTIAPQAFAAGPALVFRDKVGTPRMTLRMQNDDPSIQLSDAAGTTRFEVLNIGDPYDGGATLRFFAPTGKERRNRLRLRMTESSISILDDHNNERLQIFMTAGHRDPRSGRAFDTPSRPVVMLADEDGRMRVTLGASMLSDTSTGDTIDSESALVFFDKAGKVISRTPTR